MFALVHQIYFACREDRTVLKITPDEANEWLHRHFADDPDPRIEIIPSASEKADPAAYRQLLNILFAPRAEGADS